MNINQLSDKEQEIFELLKEVMDPEVAVNIVDLGLIYEVHYSETKIHVVTTLSSRGCPLGDTILRNIEVIIETQYPSHEVTVELTWEPEWTPEFITDAGRAALN